MAGIVVETQPMCEPVSIVEAKSYLHVSDDGEDDLISTLITGAREQCEMITRRSFINKGYLQTLDCFPYYTDSIQSSQAYPPAYYSLPRFSTTLWNYSQMIKLFYSRLAAGSSPTIKYVGTDGTKHALTGTLDMSDGTKDFLADYVNEPPRLFPKAGQYWPPVMYVPNAVELHYIAGMNDEAVIAAAIAAFRNQSPVPTADEVTAKESALRRADVPGVLRIAILQLMSHWFDNRWAVMAENLREVPFGIQNLLWGQKVMDVAPTRG